MAYRSPADPKSIPDRPLNKGMLLHLPSNSIDPGGMLDIKNMDVKIRGLRKRKGVSPYSVGTVDYGDIQGIENFWQTSGDQVTFAFDEKFMYLVGKASLSGEYETYNTGTATGTSTGSTVTGTSTLWDTGADIRSGDVIVLDIGNANEEEHEIDTVISDTELTLKTPLSNTHSSVSYEIRKAFSYPEPFFLDWTNNGQKIIFADFDRPLRAYDESGLAVFDSVGDYIPGTVTYFNDRLFIGRTIEGGVTRRQRIRWSGVGFSNHSTFEADNFIELPYTSGILLKLEPFSNFLVAYFTDVIYMGRGTNNANLPVSFQRVETGGIGLVGMNAIAPHIDGHFFVGQDDVYFMSNRGFERIGTPIIRDIIDRVEDKWKITAAVDPLSERVLFGVPYESSSINRVYAYNYKSQAWSWMDIDASSLSSIGLVATTTWEDLIDAGSGGILATNTWDSGFGTTYPTWESLSSSEIPVRKVYYGQAQQVWTDNNSGTDNGNAIITEFITRDIDENAPDVNKLWTRITLKLEEPVTEALVFTISGSIDRGNTWKALGTMTIDTGDDEGHVNFRLSGQLARFRFTSAGDYNNQYTVVELVRRVSGKGMEVPGRSTG